MGPFEEEEERTGIASDVVKVKGGDPATPGLLTQGNPGTVTIPQYRVNTTKQRNTEVSKVASSHTRRLMIYSWRKLSIERSCLPWRSLVASSIWRPLPALRFVPDI